MNKYFSKILFMVCLAALLPAAGIAAQSLPLNVVARISIQLPAQRHDDLKALVTTFASTHGFSAPESATMPRNRKIFLPSGVFSMMFRASGEDYYLFMQNVRGQDCVVIELYAPQQNAKYQNLLGELGQSVQQHFGRDARVYNSPACESGMQ